MDEALFLAEIEAVRARLVTEINVQLDELTQRIRSGKCGETPSTLSIPLSSDTRILKGAKPISVSYKGMDIPTFTWKSVIETILGICNEQEQYHKALLEARGTIAGRDRMILSDSPDGMTKPLKIDEELFVEVHYDTDTLFRILKDRIFAAIGYDGSGFTINYQRLRSGQ